MKKDIKDFFDNVSSKNFKIMSNNGDFSGSPLSTFFDNNLLNKAKKTIKNPFFISSIAIATSLSSLHLSLQENIKDNIKTIKPIENFLILQNIKDFHEDDFELYIGNNTLNLIFSKHLINVDQRTGLSKYLLLDGSTPDKDFINNLNWDFKSPAKPFEKYFTDEFKNKLPSIEDLNEIEEYYGLPKNLLSSMAHKESRYSLYKSSHKNAKGFLGFQEATARDFGLVSDNNNQIFNAYAAADTAARYILWLNGYVNGKKADIFDSTKDKFGFSNLDYALAAYNAGPHKVKKQNKKRIPNYKETRNYISDINLLIRGEGYIINKGDTIYDISKKMNVSVENLFRNNLDIESNNDLKAGEILVVSNNENKEISVKIEKGHNMYKISKKTGIDLKTLLTYNNLEENSIIKVGDEIKIPPLKSELDKKYRRKI
tara:strand:- start:3143 stop:4426 length:1284 start_codon:yes stop_codon:yes gene_type:complete